jgi:hypothetical protein
MSVKLDWLSALFVLYGENRNYFLTVASPVTRLANEAVMARMVGSGGVCFWRESEVCSLEPAVK